MTALHFEAGVAGYFTAQGFDVELTPYSNDFGVDVFASMGSERIAIQAKMYGGTNRRSAAFGKNISCHWPARALPTLLAKTTKL